MFIMDNLLYQNIPKCEKHGQVMESKTLVIESIWGTYTAPIFYCSECGLDTIKAAKDLAGVFPCDFSDDDNLEAWLE